MSDVLQDCSRMALNIVFMYSTLIGIKLKYIILYIYIYADY